MEWTDEGIVLGVKRHGEGNGILELLTREHGRHLGLVRGAAGARLRPILQPGNRVAATWRARLDEHLGHYAIEGLELTAALFLQAAHALYGVSHLTALCRLLPERDPHPQIHATLEALLGELLDPRSAGPGVARFEVQILAELGFGLDLERCAATGTTSELVYVSPRSGRAVSREAGHPWHEKLLRLPSFLAGAEPLVQPSEADLVDAFAITSFFLSRHVLEPRGLDLSDARDAFVSATLAAIERSRVAS